MFKHRAGLLLVAAFAAAVVARAADIPPHAHAAALVHAAERLESQGYLSAETRTGLIRLAGSTTGGEAAATGINRALDALYPARGEASRIPVNAGPLFNFPRPDRVVGEVPQTSEGAAWRDPARQYAALNIMRDALRWASGKPLVQMFPDAPEGHALALAYFAFEAEVEGNAVRRFNGDGCNGYDCNRKRYFDAKSEFQLSDAYRREVLRRYFTDKTVGDYIAARNAKAPPITRTAERAVPPQEQSGSSGGLWRFLRHWWWIPVLVVVACMIFFRTKSEPPPKPGLSDNYGRATFAPRTSEFLHEQTFRKGVFLGKSAKPSKGDPPPPLWAPWAPVFSEPEHHTLIVARTGSGKGTRVIVPTLLRYDGSMLVIDPKGENAAITARMRRDQLGQAVHILNPWGELGQPFAHRGFKSTALYNPLDILDRNDPNAVAIAQAIASTIIPKTPGDNAPFWQGSAANILTAVLLWVTDHPTETKTLARVRHLLSQSRKDLTEKCLLPMASSEAFGGAVMEMVSHFIDMAQETYSGIMSNVAEATKFLSDPQVKAATDSSTFSMDDLIFKDTTIFLVIPPDRMATQQAWLRLVLTAATQTFKKHLHDDRRGNRRCMFLIDEFPALGTIEDIPVALAAMRGYGLDFTLVIQGIDQLKANYGKSAETILNNCAFKWFCNVSDLETAKYVSESLGQKTVPTVNKNTGSSEGPGGAGTTQSESHGETGRALMRPEEVLTLGRDFAICLAPLKSPLYLQPIDYWQLTDAFGYLKENHPHLYWTPPLEYDANPYFPGSRGQKQQGQSQSGNTGGQPATGTRMTKEQAREVLEVGPNATRAEIKTAFRRNIAKFHPDRDGNNYIAKLLNAAHDTLLDK